MAAGSDIFAEVEDLTSALQTPPLPDDRRNLEEGLRGSGVVFFPSRRFLIRWTQVSFPTVCDWIERQRGRGRKDMQIDLYDKR